MSQEQNSQKTEPQDAYIVEVSENHVSIIDNTKSRLYNATLEKKKSTEERLALKARCDKLNRDKERANKNIRDMKRR